VWEIIEKERIDGYQHRAPVKKVKKESIKSFLTINQEPTSQCLLTIKKINT
jgi:hypothetical protein